MRLRKKPSRYNAVYMLISIKKKPFFSVQYHPEASPGPQDSRYLFKDFEKLMEKNA